MGRGGDERHGLGLGFGRGRCAASGLASGGRGLGLGFRRQGGGINRWGRAYWAVPFVGRAAQRVLTGRSNHVPGQAT
jgi:hypothetical protein